MGVILKEEYVCDFCGKTISGGDRRNWASTRSDYAETAFERR